MPLRSRLTLMSALVVGVTVVLASVVCYAAMRSELRGQVDEALLAQAERVERVGSRFGRGGGGPGGPGGPFPGPPPRAGGPAGYAQVLTGDGAVLQQPESAEALPVTAEDLSVAAGARPAVLADRTVGGEHVRVLTVALPGRGAVQLGRTLEGVDSTLDRLRLILLLLCLAGTAFAAAMSRVFSRPVMAPITELTEAAEHIQATGDLGRRVGGGGSDEVGRMATSFDAMLERLQASVAAQRQLIADASHELRTPVTSLRTNMEVLLESDELDREERRAVLEDVVEQTEELSALVADVIELARDDQPAHAVEEVRLDELAGEAIARARRHAPGVTFDAWLQPTTVEAVPDRLGRAVNNLLDNAAKYGGAPGPVEVHVARGELVVRDHGPGVPAAELAHLFDRFFRGSNARERPGSGLGLAIVRQVAESHGGAVSAEAAPGGGLLIRLRLREAGEG